MILSATLAIAIGFADNKCAFTIADNGKGFQPEHVYSGIGIDSMKNRVATMEEK